MKKRNKGTGVRDQEWGSGLPTACKNLTLLIALTIPLFHFSTLPLSAAVPLRWTVETSRATPAQFEAYHGETLTLEATLQSSGKPLELSGIAALYWQTNGMGSAYWEATAAVNSNRLSAVWTPEMDVGAKSYNCFIGVPGTVYHAAFQLRLRPSPGATPNVLPLPTPVIDFSKIRVLNPPWESGGGGGVNTNTVIDIANATIETNDTVKALSSSVTTLSSSVASLQSTKLDGPTDPTLTISGKAADALKVKEALAGKRGITDLKNYPETEQVLAERLPVVFNGQTFSNIRVMTDGPFLHDGSKYRVCGDVPEYQDITVAELDAKGRYVDGPGATFGGVVPTVGMQIACGGETGVSDGDTIALASEIPAPYTPPPYLRAYDEVRKCWWRGRMVNGVINWEVE